ncbi:MAG: TfoX/Sxy family protein, partial [Thermomicrobia bacterium]|nr:TfoX/Sxy family protein [Thermomicrobia bacterium]
MTDDAVAPAIQAYVEEHLLHWPGVTKRKIFGHDGYYIEGRLFAFVGDGGIVLKPPADEKAAVRAFDGAG